MKTTYGEAKVNRHQVQYNPAVNELRVSASAFIDLINSIPFPPDNNEAEEGEGLDLKRRATNQVEIACLLAEKAANI